MMGGQHRRRQRTGQGVDVHVSGCPPGLDAERQGGRRPAAECAGVARHRRRFVEQHGPGHRRRPRRARPDEPLPDEGGLRGRGCARPARRAWRWPAQLRPSVITLDVMMPGMDGWAVLTALKADPSWPDIPVVMVTMTDDRRHGYALGAADYLTKPIDPGAARRDTAEARRDGRPPRACSSSTTTRPMREMTASAAAARRLDGHRGGERPCRARAHRGATARVIILDLMMPEMDGFEFIDALAQSDRWHERFRCRGDRQGPDRRGSRAIEWVGRPSPRKAASAARNCWLKCVSRSKRVCVLTSSVRR